MIKQRWREWKRGMLPSAAPFIASLAVAIGRTLRMSSPGFDQYKAFDRPMLFSGWHGRTFMALTFFRGKGMWTMMSNSRDGEMQHRIFTKFGFRTIRGSTGREGVKAAREAINALKENGQMAYTPDGPRGPSGIVQPGIMMIAQKSGAEIVPVGVSSKWRILAKSWDRYLVPIPFSKAVMVFGPSVKVPKDATEEEVEQLRQQVEKVMHETQAEADRLMGHK